MLEKYPKEVKIVFKNFPLDTHRFARSAALAALAANAQGKFWEYHDKLYANYTALDDSKFQQFATQLGLDQEEFNKDLKSAALQALVDRDFNEGRKLGVRGIPAIYVNGKPLEDRSPRGFQTIIDAELRKKKELGG